MVRVNTNSKLYPNIERLYPNSKITGIKEICFNGTGWVKATYVNTLYNSLGSNVSHLYDHAESIQLEVVDQYGQKRYPDYKLTELV